MDGVVSDKTSFNAGVRQFAYSEDGGVLKIWINGRRFIPRGGNWGFSESMLRYRAREFETALRYHRDEHFNMIRNWVGQTGDKAFYDAADRFGVVIWQDFWLANPWDGPDPDDAGLFLDNARDYLMRIRNHVSLGIFCGRNEGFPPQQIDAGFSLVRAAADQEVEVRPFDLKCRRSQLAGRAVAVEVTVGQSLPLEAHDVHLIG